MDLADTPSRDMHAKDGVKAPEHDSEHAEDNGEMIDEQGDDEEVEESSGYEESEDSDADSEFLETCYQDAFKKQAQVIDEILEAKNKLTERWNRGRRRHPGNVRGEWKLYSTDYLTLCRGRTNGDRDKIDRDWKAGRLQLGETPPDIMPLPLDLYGELEFEYDMPGDDYFGFTCDEPTTANPDPEPVQASTISYGDDLYMDLGISFLGKGRMIMEVDAEHLVDGSVGQKLQFYGILVKSERQQEQEFEDSINPMYYHSSKPWDEDYSPAWVMMNAVRNMR